MRIMGRVCWERARPRPPVRTRVRKVSELRGWWREGSLAWRFERDGMGRRVIRRRGARAMKAMIWWGVL